MYKIYINEIPLILKHKELLKKEEQENKNVLVAKYTGKTRHLLQYVDLCEKGTPTEKIIIYSSDYKQLKKDFLSLFVINKAAGGLIKNELNEFLFIFRRGFWDLPKGKLELGETKKQTAIREVNEETGIVNMQIVSKLGITNHLFKNKSGVRLIKKSFWYLMTTSKQKLIPQTTEDIDKAIWLNLEDFYATCKPIYGNIKDILQVYEEESVNKSIDNPVL